MTLVTHAYEEAYMMDDKTLKKTFHIRGVLQAYMLIAVAYLIVFSSGKRMFFFSPVAITPSTASPPNRSA